MMRMSMNRANWELSYIDGLIGRPSRERDAARENWRANCIAMLQLTWQAHKYCTCL